MRKRKLRFTVTALLLTAAVVLGQVSAPARAQSAEADALEEKLDELAEEQAQVEEQIAQLRSQLSDNLDKAEQLVAQKSLIDQEIFLLYQQTENINDQINTYTQLVAQAQVEVEQAQAEFERVYEHNKSRLRVMEKNSSVSYWSVIFQASDLLDMLDRIKSISRIAQADRECLDQVRQAARAVEAAKANLETELGALEATRQELAANQETLESRRQEAETLLQEAMAKGQEFAYLLEKSEEKQDALALELAQTQLAYEEATRPTEPPTTAPPVTEPPETQPPETQPPETQPPETQPPETQAPQLPEQPPVDSGVYWMVPCEYVYLSSPFGYRYHPLSGIWKMHNGIDLAAYQGNPIYATRSGYVTRASYEEGGAGYYVSIDHGDGYSSIYMHMTHYIVGYGEYVEQGQVIGYVGSTGGSSGPHLHFGISLWGTYVNPADYIAV